MQRITIGLNTQMTPTTLDNERFFVEYCDTAGNIKPFRVYWNINDKHITKFWKKSLLSNYIGHKNITQYVPLDKRYMNRGFPTTRDQVWSRDIKQIISELNNAIKIINSRLHNRGYPHIDLRFTEERCFTPKHFRDDFNRLHHHFEVLIGQVWSLSKWYSEESDRRTMWAIHCLNNACHEIESIVNGIYEINNPEQHNTSFGFTGISFNSPNWDGVNRTGKIYHEYDEACFDDWETTWLKYGTLIPYYSQLGKNLREVFEDGDDYIDDGNISSHCLMTGEVNICLSGPGELEALTPGNMLDDPREQAFAAWLKERGFDYNDPKVGAGFAHMGEIAWEAMGLKRSQWKTLDAKIKACDNVTAIGFVDSRLTVISTRSCRYDYTWQEQYKAEQVMFEQDHEAPYNKVRIDTGSQAWGSEPTVLHDH